MLTSKTETEVSHSGRDKLLLRGAVLAKLALLTSPTLIEENNLDDDAVEMAIKKTGAQGVRVNIIVFESCRAMC